MSKVIVITGGTGGIGYQAALALASLPERHTVVVTGRSKESAEKAVAILKEASQNDSIQYALGDMSLQSSVTALGQDLLKRFPVIDELINNAGNLSTGEKETTADGIEKNFAVNVMAPYLLTKALRPALKAATPTPGKVQITSGGMSFDTLMPNDLFGESIPVGIMHYSHSKRVMEAMAINLSQELNDDGGIVVNVVGGALVAGSTMTGAVGWKEMPWFMKMIYPLVRYGMFAEDKGKKAKKAAAPVIWATFATATELGTGKSYLAGPKEGKFKSEVLDEANQEAVMKLIESKVIKK